MKKRLQGKSVNAKVNGSRDSRTRISKNWVDEEIESGSEDSDKVEDKEVDDDDDDDDDDDNLETADQKRRRFVINILSYYCSFFKCTKLFYITD